MEWNLRDEIARIVSEGVGADISSESIADRIMDLLKRNTADEPKGADSEAR